MYRIMCLFALWRSHTKVLQMVAENVAGVDNIYILVHRVQLFNSKNTTNGMLPETRTISLILIGERRLHTLHSEVGLFSVQFYTKTADLNGFVQL